jgi:signal peptidase I
VEGASPDVRGKKKYFRRLVRDASAFRLDTSHDAWLRGAVVEIAAPPGSRSADSLLKRVVAAAGDSVEIRDGALWVNDLPVARTAVAGDCRYPTRTPDGGWQEGRCLDFVETLDGRPYHAYCTPGVACGDVAREVVPVGRIWVAGDHRDHSADSRVSRPHQRTVSTVDVAPEPDAPPTRNTNGPTVAVPER